MTIKEALNRVMRDRPGEATEEELIKWLSDLDTRWSMEVIDTHYSIQDAYQRKVTQLIDEIEDWVADNGGGDDTQNATYGYGPQVGQRVITQQVNDIEAWATGEPAEQLTLPDPFFGYDSDTPDTTELLIHSPDDEVYIYWLYSKIDVRLGEIARYNNDAMMFNAAWSEAAKRYNRTHMPKGRNLRHVVYGTFPVPRPPVDDPLNQRVDPFRWR